MKVKLIDDAEHCNMKVNFTLNKIYDVIKENCITYILKDDNGNICSLWKIRFEIVEV
ncbi:MAG: hypothetical protein ACRCXT_23815 [Paraclostridium sp.]